MTILVAVITDDALSYRDIEPTLEIFQSIVGGYIERWQLTQSAHLYFDEDGIPKGLPVNPMASRILGPLNREVRNIMGIPTPGFVLPELRGPVMVVGSQEPHGVPDGEDHSLGRRVCVDMVVSMLGRSLLSKKGQ